MEMRDSKVNLLVILPCFNEASVIGEVVRSIKKTFNKSKFSYDILVVDDCSSDTSSEAAKKSGAITVRHLINQGAGSSTLTGLAYAKAHGYDVVVTMDSDGQHKPEDALACVKALLSTNSDLVIGSRMINASGMSTVKQIGNWGLTTITYLLFGVKSTDSQSGLRAYSQRAINELSWDSSRYEFCSEMLWRAKKLNLRLTEHPISAVYTDYSKGKGQNNWNGVNILLRLISHKFTEALK